MLLTSKLLLQPKKLSTPIVHRMPASMFKEESSRLPPVSFSVANSRQIFSLADGILALYVTIE